MSKDIQVDSYVEHVQNRAREILGVGHKLIVRFIFTSQIDALQVLGIDRAEEALSFKNSQGQALQFICAEGDNTYRSPTKEDIVLAKKFTDLGKFKALQVYGIGQYEKALEFQYASGRALEYLCRQADGSYSVPTDRDEEIARTIHDDGQFAALLVFGKDRAGEALPFKGIKGQALQIICSEKGGTYRSPTEHDIAIANTFKNIGQLHALRLFGVNRAEEALQFNPIQGDALTIISMERLSRPTVSDVSIAKKFSTSGQVEALRILGHLWYHNALKFFMHSQSVKLREYHANQEVHDSAYGKTPVFFLKLKDYLDARVDDALLDGREVARSYNHDSLLKEFVTHEGNKARMKHLCKNRDQVKTQELCEQNIDLLRDQWFDGQEENGGDGKELSTVYVQLHDSIVVQSDKDTYEDKVTCTIIGKMVEHCPSESDFATGTS